MSHMPFHSCSQIMSTFCPVGYRMFLMLFPKHVLTVLTTLEMHGISKVGQYYVQIWYYRLSSFQAGGIKLERFKK